jgi:hypothetical protein
MLSLFTHFELSKFSKFFKTRTLPKAITSALFLIVFLFVAFGIYGFFYSSFRYINIVFEPEFKLPLFLFIYEFFAIILAGVIMLSAMVTGLFNLFRGENNSWILSSPFFALFPRVVSLKGLISSTWPLLVMFLPMVIAFNKTYHLGITSLLLIVLSVVALLLLLNALTLIFVVGVGYFYYVLSRKINSVVFSFRGLVGVEIPNT